MPFFICAASNVIAAERKAQAVSSCVLAMGAPYPRFAQETILGRRWLAPSFRSPQRVCVEHAHRRLLKERGTPGRRPRRSGRYDNRRA